MFSVKELAKRIEAQIGNSESETPSALFSSLEISGLATLADAGPTDLAFFFSRNYEKDLMTTKAGVIVTGPAFVEPLRASGLPQWKSSLFLVCAHPYLAMAQLSKVFSEKLSSHHHVLARTETEIHPTAVIDPSVRMGEHVKIGPFVVIEKDVVIGNSVVIEAHSMIGPACSVGDASVVFAGVTLYERTVIGKRCRLHSGVVLGADGFGYVQVMDESGKIPIRHEKIYHLGRVVLEDDVEIGANSTVDRGTFGDTRVCKQAKLDNQVQVGHNCTVGEGSILCGTSGMAGSSSLGKFVLVGAQSGTGNQVHIGDYSTLAAYTGAPKDVPPFSDMTGVPARPTSDQYKILAIQNKLLRERTRKK